MYSVYCGRESRDHHLCVNFPRLFADFHALLLLTPRHPPCALDRLATEIPNSKPIHSLRSKPLRQQTDIELIDLNLNLLTISHSGQALLSKPGRSRIQSKFITNTILPPHECDLKSELATLPKNLFNLPCSCSLHLLTRPDPIHIGVLYRCKLPNNQIVKYQFRR